jgi:hypothetical protein
MSLVPCPSCRRHARLEERQCPFCAAPFDAATQVERAAAQRHGVPPSLGLKRAFLYAVGTGTLVLTSCEGAAPERGVASTASSERELAQPTEPHVEYDLQWRSLSDEELSKLVHPKPPPPEVTRKRAVVPKSVCNIDYNSDAMYGGCF